MFKTTVGGEGMACGMCEQHLCEAVRKAFAVKKVKASKSKNRLEIISEDRIPEERIRKCIDATGYDFTSYSSEACAKQNFFNRLKGIFS